MFADVDNDDDEDQEDQVKLCYGNMDLKIFPQKYPNEPECTKPIFVCPRFFTNYLMYNRPNDVGMEIADVYEDVLNLLHQAFAFWSGSVSVQDPNTVAWNAAAYIQFKSSFKTFWITAEQQANQIYIFSFEAIPPAQNAQLMAMTGQQNGISYLADIHKEDKENMSFFSNE